MSRGRDGLSRCHEEGHVAGSVMRVRIMLLMCYWRREYHWKCQEGREVSLECSREYHRKCHGAGRISVSARRVGKCHWSREYHRRCHGVGIFTGGIRGHGWGVLQGNFQGSEASRVESTNCHGRCHGLQTVKECPGDIESGKGRCTWVGLI